MRSRQSQRKRGATESKWDPLVSLSPEMVTMLPGANAPVAAERSRTPSAAMEGDAAVGPDRAAASASISPVSQSSAFSSMVRIGGSWKLPGKCPKAL
jgi:hypothetical protein